MITKADTGKTECDYLKYMKCTPTLDKVDKKLGGICLRRITTDEGEFSPVAAEDMKNRTELNKGER